jgi:hypothetical protein
MAKFFVGTERMKNEERPDDANEFVKIATIIMRCVAPYLRTACVMCYEGRVASVDIFRAVFCSPLPNLVELTLYGGFPREPPHILPRVERLFLLTSRHFTTCLAQNSQT